VGDLSLAAVEEVRGWQGGPTATGSAVGRGGAGPEGVESTEAWWSQRRGWRRRRHDGIDGGRRVEVDATRKKKHCADAHSPYRAGRIHVIISNRVA
jgi:hypothetical protein